MNSSQGGFGPSTSANVLQPRHLTANSVQNITATIPLGSSQVKDYDAKIREFSPLRGAKPHMADRG